MGPKPGERAGDRSDDLPETPEDPELNESALEHSDSDLQIDLNASLTAQGSSSPTPMRNEQEIIVSIEKEIGRQLTEKAEKSSLTVTNVKTIIRQVLTNEYVTALLEKGGPEENLVELTRYEPKLTRSKAKELMSASSIPVSAVNIPWVPLPPPSETHVLIGEDLKEDDSGDEYIPGEEESEDDKDESAASESDSSSLPPPTPPAPVCMENQATQTTNYSEDGVFKVPGPPKTALEEAAEDAANIALRTRSKINLSATPLEVIEKNFVPPDITTDMYDLECDDEEWKEFLKGFTEPLEEVTKPTEDDEQDPEYNILADDENNSLDNEDFRVDKAVKITKKEVKELWEELFDYLHNISGEYDDKDKEKSELTINEVVENSFPDLSHNENLETTIQTDKEGKSENESKKLLDVNISHNQLCLLEHQLRQHVQMLTQNFLLLYEHPEFHNYSIHAKEYLLNFKFLSEGKTQSMFRPINLLPALNLIDSWVNMCASDTEEMKQVRKHTREEYFKSVRCKMAGNWQYILTFPKFLLETISKSEVFLYPSLLPKIPFKSSQFSGRKGFTDAEDGLLAFGIDQFKTFLTQKYNKATIKDIVSYIQEYMMPHRDKQVILKHISKRKHPRCATNPIQQYILHNKLMPFVHYIYNLDHFGPPYTRRPEELPFQWKTFIYPNLSENNQNNQHGKRQEVERLGKLKRKKEQEGKWEMLPKITNIFSCEEVASRCSENPLMVLSPSVDTLLETDSQQHMALQIQPTQVQGFLPQQVILVHNSPLNYWPVLLPRSIGSPSQVTNPIILTNIQENKATPRRKRKAKLTPSDLQNRNRCGKICSPNKSSLNQKNIQTHSSIKNNNCTSIECFLFIILRPIPLQKLIRFLAHIEERQLSNNEHTEGVTAEPVSAEVNESQKPIEVLNMPNLNIEVKIKDSSADDRNDKSTNEGNEKSKNEGKKDSIEIELTDVNEANGDGIELSLSVEHKKPETVTSSTVSSDNKKDKIVKNLEFSTITNSSFQKANTSTEVEFCRNSSNIQICQTSQYGDHDMPSSRGHSSGPTGFKKDNPEKSSSTAKSEVKPNAKKELSGAEKKKNKLRKDFLANLSIATPEDEETEKHKNEKFAIAYYDKLRDTLELADYHKIMRLLNDFGSGDVVDLYNDVQAILLPKYVELAEEFLFFLRDREAYAVGQLIPWLELQARTKFLRKLEIYMKDQPAQLRKIYNTLMELTKSEDSSMERIKGALVPMLKGNSILLDLFLQNFRDERPPPSLLEGPYETIDLTKELARPDTEELYETFVVPNTEDKYGGQNCICHCHRIEDNEYKSRYKHCNSCGLRFANGRLYLSTGRIFQPATVTFKTNPDVNHNARLMGKAATLPSSSHKRKRPDTSPNKLSSSSGKEHLEEDTEDEESGKRKKSVSQKSPRKRKKNDTSKLQESCKPTSPKKSPARSNDPSDTLKETIKPRKRTYSGKKAKKEESKKTETTETETETEPEQLEDVEVPAEITIKEEDIKIIADVEESEHEISEEPQEKTGDECMDSSGESLEKPLTPGQQTAESESEIYLEESSQDNYESDDSSSSTESAKGSQSDSNTNDEPPWRREEDTVILETLQKEDDKEYALQIISDKLPNRTVGQIRSRLSRLMDLLIETLKNT